LLGAKAMEVLAVIAEGPSINGALDHAVCVARGACLYVLERDDSWSSAEAFGAVRTFLKASPAGVVHWFGNPDQNKLLMAATEW